jgi:hypothetical protein
VQDGEKSCERAFSQKLFGDGKTSRMNRVATSEVVRTSLLGETLRRWKNKSYE